MITIITPEILKEKSFQKLIKDYLIQDNNYIESFNDNYNRELAIDEKQLFDFLETTQEKAMERLRDIYKTNYKNKILKNLNKDLKSRGSIDVIKHGVKDFGVKLDLAYFKPPTNLNPDQFLLYQQNILSVTEELVYDSKKDDRIDLVIFLNGIPIITMELKNSFTGQTYRDAIKQFENDRSSKDQMFMFKERSIVNFAIDTDEAYMTTKLNGSNTRFLPFNKGLNGGKGNPQIEGKLGTHYIWEEVLKKDSLLEILSKFTYIEKKEKVLENKTKKIKETLIFPRYHQLDCVREVLSHVKKNGSGNKYLIQHSAGSGKTNSITWLTHRLASLHNVLNEVIFDGVIVVTDRVLLDQQLQESIFQLEHKVGVVEKINENSTQLAKEIEKGTKIIISTIQKFPFILDKIAGTKGKKYAIVIDEAHSSTSGTSMTALKESLNEEEALSAAIEQEPDEIDTEDKINAELEKYSDTSNISFFAFTATPKGTTLRLFGVPFEANDKDGNPETHYKPFHIYSMKQAIEEGFILDVLQNYITYKMYYNVNKKIADDPTFDKSKAAKAIVRFVTLHPHNISQKTEIIIEHFRNHTMNKIGGEAKAMLVTSSRLHAVRYKLAFDNYIEKHGYRDLKTFIAFSGKVKYKGESYQEPSMNNGISMKRLRDEFDKNDSRVLIVADKYQTGFDQPKLHTMYVDKKLSGVKAVQTLSRLNRIHDGKEDTFVLDFVNDPEDILASFLPFYKTTILDNDIEPNEIYAIERTIYDKKVINQEDVIAFTDIYYKEKHKQTDISIMNHLVDNSAKRTNDFTREELLEFRSLIKKFINLYNLIIQVAPIIDSDLHRLSVYLRFLVKKLNIDSPSGVDITDKVLLQFYKLKKTGEGSIDLEKGDDSNVEIIVSGGGQVAMPDIDTLSSIIEKLNEKYGTSFSESEKLAVAQIRSSLQANEELQLKAKNNSYDDFKYAFAPTFLNDVIKEYDKNQNFYGKILEDDGFRKKLMELIMFDVYEKFTNNLTR